MGPFEIAVTVGAAAVAAVVFFVIGYFLRKATAEKKIHSAEAESKRLVDEAKKDAEPRDRIPIPTASGSWTPPPWSSPATPR